MISSRATPWRALPKGGFVKVYTISRTMVPNQVLQRSPRTVLRLVFWILGILIACLQTWAYRYRVTADSISYLDMSDGVMPGGDWHRLINGTWSPLYPFLLGIFRRVFGISPSNEVAAAHLLNIVVFVFAFMCFEFFLRNFLLRMENCEAAQGQRSTFPLATYLVIAYSPFLWSSFLAISLQVLRPDMLMSGFLYLSIGLL